ncbi:MAG: hypothetical protein H3Z53_09315 [archaeon]|nr:hypothetical protein [archaeon]MCP8314553.1 hypothetical protein [archaeon]MCP8316903.1 hypothetical protein [archaeon]MCP8320934.1 hypothetical protein [archaeon]
MPMVKDTLYWPSWLRNEVKRITKKFQELELKENLVKVELRDVIIVAIQFGLPMVESISLEKFKERLNEIKIRG